MISSTITRRCLKDTAGRRNFYSWFQVDSLCLLLWCLVSMQDIQWHSSPVTFSGNTFARSFLGNFSGNPENNFPGHPESPTDLSEFCWIHKGWFIYCLHLVWAPTGTSTSADFSVSQKAIAVPSVRISDLSPGRGGALPDFFPWMLCLSPISAIPISFQLSFTPL